MCIIINCYIQTNGKVKGRNDICQLAKYRVIHAEYNTFLARAAERLDMRFEENRTLCF